MSRALKPDELERMRREVEQVEKRAARDKLGSIIPFEPTPDGGQPEAHIHLPNNNNARLKPNGDLDIDISATRPDKQPVDMTEATGLPGNPDGSVTVDPRKVIDTLGKIGGIELGRSDRATQFSNRIGITGATPTRH